MKHIFAIGVGKSGIPCSLGRVDSLPEVASAIQRNNAHGLKTHVREMNLDQVERIVRKMDERKKL